MGIVGSDRKRVALSERALDRMLSTLNERGPDGRGKFVSENVCFGHTRLAVRDIEHGKQPWFSPDRTCALVYNGEIYNEHELRSELSDFHTFRTACDTEVIMAAYQRWGTNAVHRFRGMFAIAVYDFNRKRLWLVRDRLGVKPLFFSKIANQLVFASSIRTILSHPSFSKQPDWQVASHFLTTTRLSMGRRTIYNGIQQLQPAEQLIFEDGRTSISRYWEYPTERTTQSFEDAVDSLHGELNESVKLRLKSDIPVGMFLSGGVDSSTLAAIVNNSTTESMHATCAGTSSDENPQIKQETCAEAHFANRCAEHFQFQLNTVHVGANGYRNRWQDLVGEHRLPLSTPSDVLIHEIARAARRNVGVVLGGEGADELFCGYEIPHWAGHDYDHVMSIRRSKHGPRPSRLFLASMQRQYGRSEFVNESDHYFALNSLIPSHVKPKILNPNLLEGNHPDQQMYDYYQSIYDTLPDRSTAERHSMLLQKVNLEALLFRLDQATMHSGLEARVPYTDHVLVEKMSRLPLDFRINQIDTKLSRRHTAAELSALGKLKSKRILRQLASRLLPSDLANRKKASFPTQLHDWFSNDWKRWVAGFLSESRFANYVFQPSFIQEIVAAPAAAGMWLWPILNLAIWGDREFS